MNELTDERLAEMRRIAEAATPGEWKADGPAGNLDSSECRVAEVVVWGEADAQHIAAFDPPTALALLDELERLREEMDSMVPKDWHGLMAILEDIYPEGIFPTMADDPKRDAGPRIVSLIRVVDELQARLDAVEALSLNAIGKHYSSTLNKILLAARGPRE